MRTIFKHTTNRFSALVRLSILVLLAFMGNSWSCGGHDESACTETCVNTCITEVLGVCVGFGDVCSDVPPYCDSGRLLWGGRCYAYPTWCGDANESACTIDVQVYFGVSPCNGSLQDIAGTCREMDSDGFPSMCGGSYERPCTIIEHIPSCKPDLVENFITNRCEPCGGSGEAPCGLVCDAGLWLDMETNICRARPSDCGGANERACLVTEFIPSCEEGYTELNGSCRSFDAAGFPTHCGDHNEPACLVNEHIPSCKENHVESEGMCYHCGAEGEAPCGLVCESNLLIDMESWTCEGRPSDCGRVGQRACNLWEFAPSCAEGYVEYAGQCYNNAECGNENQRPCTWAEGIFPSCREGMYEDVIAGLCKPLEENQAAFWETFLAFTDDITDLTPICRDYLRQNATTEAPFEEMEINHNCQQNFAIGFVCQAPTVLDIFRNADAFVDTVIDAYVNEPCTNTWEPIYREATQHGTPDVVVCPEGQFFDFIDGGSCWSCPGGFSRTVYPVDGDQACSIGGSTPGGYRELCAVTTPLVNSVGSGLECLQDVFNMPETDSASSDESGYEMLCMEGGGISFGIAADQLIGASIVSSATQRRQRLLTALQVVRATLRTGDWTRRLVTLESCQDYLFTEEERDSINATVSVEDIFSGVSGDAPGLFRLRDRNSALLLEVQQDLELQSIEGDFSISLINTQGKILLERSLSGYDKVEIRREQIPLGIFVLSLKGTGAQSALLLRYDGETLKVLR
jgi:hypothetical protein